MQHKQQFAPEMELQALILNVSIILLFYKTPANYILILQLVRHCIFFKYELHIVKITLVYNKG